MDEKKILVSIVAIAVVVFAIMFIMFMSKQPVMLKDLDQDHRFYVEHAKQTRTYLSQVYPIAAKTFETIHPIELAHFYNKLDFVYNCCYSYNGELVDEGAGWKPLLCCSDANSVIPYTPQGFMYFWPTYASSNKHTVYSSGKDLDGIEYDVSLLGSQRPDVPWGLRADGGEVSRKYRSGPSPYWVTLYTMIRNLYYPYGPSYDPNFKKWVYQNGINTKNPSNMGFENKTRNWAFGMKAGEYVEVAHSSWEPGMTQSQGFWMTQFPGGGTGMFYRIGRTVVANNKMSVVLKMLKQLVGSKASDLSMPDLSGVGGTNFTGMSGKQILEHWYKTSDPYEIVWKYCAPDANGEGIWGPMSKTSSDGWVVVPKQWIGIDNKGVLSASGLFNPGKLGEPTEPYGPNAVLTFREVAQWYATKHGKLGAQFDFETVRNEIIDDCVSSRDYILDRVGTIVAFDEPIFWLANVLGYETVQLTVSANGNGLWSPELVHTVVPNAVWASHVKARVYDFVTGDDAKSMFDVSKDAPRYTMAGFEAWHDMIGKIITERNPFDLKTHRQCSEMGAQNGPVVTYDDKFFSQWNGCDSSSTSDACWRDTNDYGFKTPQCASNGQWGKTVEGGVTLPGRTFWGYHNKDKGCYPFYENIFCGDDSLSAKYSMLRIYDGVDYGRK